MAENLAATLLFCNAASMQDRVTITARGVITIPTRLREAFGLKPNDQLIITLLHLANLLIDTTG